MGCTQSGEYFRGCLVIALIWGKKQIHTSTEGLAQYSLGFALPFSPAWIDLHHGR